MSHTPEPEAYVPSPSTWVRRQVEQIDAAGDTNAVDVMGRPVVLVTMRGAKTGAIRKVPLMRVEHEGSYAVVASKGGAPTHPLWYANLLANPSVLLQDGTSTRPMRAREVFGEERAAWWRRSVESFPTYASYARKTDRQIPVLVVEPDPGADRSSRA